MTALPTLRETLRLAARESADLAALSDAIQGLVARLATAGPTPDPAILVEAQGADLLTQRLSGLAAFLDALAQAVPADASADIAAALAALPLADQARRLTDPASPPATEAGELTTFWD